MKFESTGEEKIKVSLSDSDMTDLDITYDELDYSNIETRRVIWTILDRARKSLGKAVDTDGRLLIEVAPDNNGGCIICFTAQPQEDGKSKKRLIMKKESEPLLFCGIDESALLDALDILKNLKDRFSQCKVYLYKNEFYIVIVPAVMSADFLTHSLCEYGNIVSLPKNCLCNLYEQGKTLLILKNQ